MAGLALNAVLYWRYITPTPKLLVGDETYYTVLAAALASGRQPEQDPFWPPLYGRALGALAVHSTSGLKLAQAAQVALWLTSAVLLYGIARRVTGDEAVALAAAALFAWSPETAAFSHYFWPEILHLSLLLLAFWLMMTFPGAAAAAVGAGSALALALATKSLLLGFLPPLLLINLLVLRTALGRRLAVRQTALLVGGLALGVVVVVAAIPGARWSPWGSGSAVFNAWVGLNDRSDVDYRDVIVASELEAYRQSGADEASRRSATLRKIGDLLAEEGPVAVLVRQARRQYLRLFDFRTFLLTQLPGGPRQAYAGEPGPLDQLLAGWAIAIYVATLVGGAAGLGLIRAKPVGWRHLVLAFILYNLALFLVLHTKTRYMIQLLPMFAVFAGAVLVLAVRAVGARSHPIAGFSLGRGHVILAVALGVLVTVLVLRGLPGALDAPFVWQS